MNAKYNAARGLVPRMLVVVVVSVACGVAYIPVIGPVSEAIGPTVGATGVMAVQVGLLLLLGALGALLLRTWLAPIIIPPSFVVGVLAVQVISLVQRSGDPAVKVYPEDVLFLIAFVVLAIVTLVVGAVAVMAGDTWLRRRRAARQSHLGLRTAPLMPPREKREREPMTSG